MRGLLLATALSIGCSDEDSQVCPTIAVAGIEVRIATTADCQAALPKAAAIDAIVMAFAASRGDVVFTGDAGDFALLQRYFPDVRVLAV